MEKYIEKRVNFNTAVKVKDLGISMGSTFNYIIYNSSFDYDGDPNHGESYKKGEIALEHANYFLNNGEHDYSSDDSYYIYEAPLLDDLRQLLTDKYNIAVYCVPSFNGKNIKWKGISCISALLYETEKNDSYYLALSDALEHAVNNM